MVTLRSIQQRLRATLENKSKVFGLSVLLLTTGSCQKQSPDEISSDYIDGTRDQRRASACSRTNLTENILTKSNLESLYICTKWDKEFPSMFNSLRKVSEESWDFFAAPINRELLNNRTTRDQLIAITKTLDENDGLNELGKVITSLSDSNFFENLNDVLPCEQSDSDCTSSGKVSAETLTKFFTVFRVRPELIKSLSNLFFALSDGVKKNPAFITGLQNALEGQGFKEKRLILFNEFIKKFRKKDFLAELEFYQNIISRKNGDEIWLQSYLNSITYSEFKYLLSYAATIRPDLWKDLRLLTTVLSKEIGCSSDSINGGVRVNVTDHMKEFLKNLFSGDQKLFFERSIQSVALIKLATQVCPNLSQYKGEIVTPSFLRVKDIHQIDFIDQVALTTRFLIHPPYYDFVQQMQRSHPSTGLEELFLITYFSNDFFVSVNELLKLVLVNSDLLSGGFSLVKKLPDHFYENISVLLKHIQELDESERQAIYNVWFAFSDDARLFFFNFLDSHYTESANVELLFSYYGALLSSLNLPLASIVDTFFDPERSEMLISSLRNVTKELAGEENRKEFQRFFSRDHMLKIIKLISSGSIPAAETLSFDKYYIEDRESTPVMLNHNFVADDLNIKCLNEITEKEQTFLKILNEFPEDCKSFVNKDPLLKTLLEFDEFGESIFGGNGVWTRNGLFGTEMINVNARVFKTISDAYGNDRSDGLSIVLRNASEYLLSPDIRGNFFSATTSLSPLLKAEGLFSHMISFYSDEQNFNRMENLFIGFEGLFNLSSKFNQNSQQFNLGPVKFSENANFKCGKYHQEIGGVPCPDVKILSEIIKRVVSRVTVSHDGQPSALDNLLNMTSSTKGLSIPYESEDQKTKVVTINESLRMFFDFTDLNLETNRSIVEVGTIPAADSEYFSTKDWRVIKKHLENAPAAKDFSLNTMERIEVVVRDVRFDENYLGAHYLNAVSKAIDYNDMVDKKYGILKACIPLKFCGKFMNKAQHRYAKNSRDTFVSLLDANTKEGWHYGDYMQALLSSLVSSSPKKSQVSSVIKKKFFGINLDIPWLQSKKTLENHNGKILGLASMVGMFTNSARVLRDRVGNDRVQVEQFLKRKDLIYLNENLFRNYSTKKHLKSVEDMLIKLIDTGSHEKLFRHLSALSYEKLRLTENLIYKSLLLISHVGDERAGVLYKDMSIFDSIGVLKLIIENHDVLTKVVNFEDEVLLKTLNKLLDVVNYGLLEDKEIGNKLLGFINEAFVFLNSLDTSNEGTLAQILNNENDIAKLKESALAFDKLHTQLAKSGNIKNLEEFLLIVRNGTPGNYEGLRRYMEFSSSPEVCSKIENQIKCVKNKNFEEITKIINDLVADSSSRLESVFNYFKSSFTDIDAFLKKIFTGLIVD